MHCFHPIFGCIDVSIGSFSWESLKNGRSDLYLGCVTIVIIQVWVLIGVWWNTSLGMPSHSLLKPLSVARIGL